VTQVRKRSAVPNIMPATVNVRRSYADCRYGQLHIATAYPSGGGFDERTPLICLHHSGGSNRAFAALLPDLGRDRSVYAIDLPGHGNSDAATGLPTIADYAGAIGDFVNGMRIRTFDVFGVEAGALVAAELAATRGQQVHRAVMMSIPYPTQAVRQIASRGESAADIPSASHIAEEWQRFIATRAGNVSAAVLQTAFADHLRAGTQEHALRGAAQEYPVAQRLPLMRLPTLVLCPNDDFREQTLRAKSCLSQGSLIELAEYGTGALFSGPVKIAQLAREFLDR
jgi:pimeloyl-ACP methyl ester carboxylesterase